MWWKSVFEGAGDNKETTREILTTLHCAANIAFFQTEFFIVLLFWLYSLLFDLFVYFFNLGGSLLL